MYATTADLREQYPDADLVQVSGEGTAGEQEATLVRALQNASSVIDGYIGTRYELPLEEVPAALRAYACDMAYYRILGWRHADHNEDARNRHKDALAFLSKVAEGKVSLDTNGAAPGDGTPAAGVRSKAVSFAAPIAFEV